MGDVLSTNDKNCRFFRKLHAVGKDHFMGYPLKRTMALTGYILKREAVANMSKQFAVVYEPVDMAIAGHWEYAVSVFWCARIRFGMMKKTQQLAIVDQM